MNDPLLGVSEEDGRSLTLALGWLERAKYEILAVLQNGTGSPATGDRELATGATYGGVVEATDRARRALYELAKKYEGELGDHEPAVCGYSCLRHRGLEVE